jgi:hypothetical protein
MAARLAGQHARETTRRLALRYLVWIVALVVAGAVALAAFGLRSPEFVGTLLVVLAALTAIERFGAPRVERWDRGATGEEDDTGRGNIDHLVVGPGGLFTIETKSHGGRIRVDRIDRKMFGQAYAQRKWLERVTGRPVEALLVFSAGYLDRAPARRHGVLVLPARMLAKHLTGRKHVLRQTEAAAIHRRLEAATAA